VEQPADQHHHVDQCLVVVLREARLLNDAARGRLVRAAAAVLDADFSAATEGVSAFTESSSNAAVVTVVSTQNPVQATGAKQPTYRASVAALNGAPAVQWDATDDLLSVASIATVSQPWYWVFVADATGAASTRRLASNNGGTSKITRDAGTDDLSVQPGTAAVTAVGTVTGAHLFIGVGNGASSAASIDGVATTGGSGTATWTLIHLGASSAATESWAGHIAYAALFTTDPTGQAEWAAFKAWCLSFYGVTVA
jgi:hypothetical protein